MPKGSIAKEFREESPIGGSNLLLKRGNDLYFIYNNVKSAKDLKALNSTQYKSGRLFTDLVWIDEKGSVHKPKIISSRHKNKMYFLPCQSRVFQNEVLLGGVLGRKEYAYGILSFD